MLIVWVVAWIVVYVYWFSFVVVLMFGAGLVWLLSAVRLCLILAVCDFWWLCSVC